VDLEEEELGLQDLQQLVILLLLVRLKEIMVDLFYVHQFKVVVVVVGLLL
jgi:hypothetical protein